MFAGQQLADGHGLQRFTREYVGRQPFDHRSCLFALAVGMQHDDAAGLGAFLDAGQDLVRRQRRIRIAGFDAPLDEPQAEQFHDIDGGVVIFPVGRSKERGVVGIVFAQESHRGVNFFLLFVGIVHGQVRVYFAVGADFEKLDR